MDTKTRKTEIFKLILENKVTTENGEKIIYKELEDDDNILSNFLEYYYTNYIHTESNDKKETVRSSNICYYMESVNLNGPIRNVVLDYIKFNKKTDVVNVKSLKSSYTKNKDEGDKDYQHYSVKMYKKNRAVLIFEKISGAVTKTMLEIHFNKAYNDYIKNTYKESDIDEYKKLSKCKIKIWNIPSPDFINSLLELDKVSLIKLFVDKEKITADDDILYSEENVGRDYIELSYKPVSKKAFSKHKVKKYYEALQDPINNKMKVKRLIIGGRKDGNSISLDTEQLKLNQYLKMNLDIDGFIDSKDLFKKYNNLINNDFKDYFDNIFIDIDEQEE